MRSMRQSSSGFFGATFLVIAALAWVAPAATTPASAADSGTIAISAGTIHLVDGGRTL